MGRGDAGEQAQTVCRTRAREGSLRSATVADIPALAELKREVARRAYAAAHGGSELEEWLGKHCDGSHYRYRIGRSCYHVIVVTDPSGEIIGVGELRQRGPNADISGVYVKEPGRGTGSRVIERLSRMARTLGCEKARVGIWRTNQPSIEFFTGRGFQRAPGGYREPTVGVRVDRYEAPLVREHAKTA